MPASAVTVEPVEKKVNQTFVRLEQGDLTALSVDAERFRRTRRQVPPPDGFIAKPIDPEETLWFCQLSLVPFDRRIWPHLSY